MKATGKLLATALAAAGLTLAATAQAEGRHGGGSHGGGFSGHHGGGHWSGRGASAGHWGGHGHWGGGRHYGSHFRGFYGPRVGFYFGVPVFWGPWWGWDGYYYPRETVVYREVIREPLYEETVIREVEPAGAAPAAPAGGPTTTPYCESAKAFFPAVRSCPEGWQDRTPTQ